MGYIEELRKIVGHRPLIFVGAVVIIVNDKNEVLFQQRKQPYGVWGLPGGLMELGESTEETARREVLEETGLSIGKLDLINVFSGPGNFVKAQNGDEFYVVTIAYSTTEFSGQAKVSDDESLDLQFFSMESPPPKLVTSHQEILEQFLTKV